MDRRGIRLPVAATAPLTFAAARARRRPGRWLAPAFGIALATAFAGVVAAEGTIAGEQAADSTLAALPALERMVRVTWSGPVTPAVEHRARSLLAGLGLGPPTEVVLLNPVRLSGTVVRPAAISPLDRWLKPAQPSPAPCLAAGCPMIASGPTSPPPTLAAPGVRISIVGRAHLSSAAPLGFVPGGPGQQTPLILSADVNGLATLPALGSIYRTHQWLALLPTAQLHSWQLAPFRARLQRAEAALLAGGSQFSFEAPFAALDTARAQADAAPTRLLLVGGGALAALALFLALAVGGLKRDVDEAVERLRTAGARRSQTAAFLLAESGLLCALAVLVGAGVALAIAALLASAAGEPAGGVLAHSLLTPAGGAAILGGWLCATALIAVLITVHGTRLADLAVLAAAVSLVLALALGSGANDSVSVLLAPLCCLAAGVVIFRATTLALPAAERLARRGPLLIRLSLVGLARAPGPAALAIAFIAVATGLGGFALSYRATLLRGAADEAANSVPVDAIASPGSGFTTPLELAPLSRWRAIAGGDAWPVRRTDASFESGGATVTVPALGIPAAAIARLHGWRAGDGAAPLATLAERLEPDGPVRNPGPSIPPGARTLSLRIASTVAVTVTADLREPDGTVRQIALGPSGRARLPPSRERLELEAFEFDEPTGLEATNGHQNAENPAAATQSAGTVRLGPLKIGAQVAIGGWRAVGAATDAHGAGARLAVRFTDSGEPGIVRPPQPSDNQPVPVLVDPGTAAAAGRSARLTLTVDGLPVAARVVGVASRFSTVSAPAAGFVVADETALAGALDAQLPGQGRADELWIDTRRSGRLRAALRGLPLTSLFRADLERSLRDAPVARAVLGTLIAAAAVSGALAILGLVVALLGAARDRAVERDLHEQGVSQREQRRELALRVGAAAAVGVCAGLSIALALTTRAVASVKAAGMLASPEPPLVTVAPWGELLAFSALALLALCAAAAIAARAARWRTA